MKSKIIPENENDLTKATKWYKFKPTLMQPKILPENENENDNLHDIQTQTLKA